jgi:dipeptidyl aminopeptidase/acylaminoacyl peptidase
MPSDAPANQPQASAGRPKPSLIPRAVLFGNPERAGVQISPDGKYISWLAPSDGVLNVWVAPAHDLGKAKPVTADKKRPVSQYFWPYDGKHLLYLQDHEGDENFHVYRVDVATAAVQDVTPLPGARAAPYGPSPRKPGTLLVGLNARDPQVFDVHTLDLASGKLELLLENQQGFTGYDVDRDLQVRFATQMTADGSSVMYRYDAAGKSWQEYDQIGGDDLLTTSLYRFDKSGTKYYAVDSRGRDTGALFLVDVETKQKELLYADARVDVASVLLHPTEATLQAVLVEFDLPRWVPLADSVKADFAALEKLGLGVPHIESRTLDDQTWIIGFAGDQASTKYYRWDRKRQRAEFLFSVKPELDRAPLVKMHPVVIESRDGLELVSYLSLPLTADPQGTGTPSKPLPMVLLVHGGPWARDNWGLDPLHQLLANRGYAVLSVNFRGSQGFGKGFINAGDKQWGKKMHEDLLDAVDWAVARKVAAKDKVCIMGGSYGGYATLAALTLTPKVFACGVDIVGPSNILTLLETIPPYWAPMISLFHRRVGDPSTEQGKQALLAISPLTHTEKIERPLLIGQGANDPRVKKSESDQIVAAMNAKKIPVSYVLFPDEGHGFARPENSIAFWALTEAFLSVHLGGAFQPILPEELGSSSLQVESGRESLPGLP